MIKTRTPKVGGNRVPAPVRRRIPFSFVSLAPGFSPVTRHGQVLLAVSTASFRTEKAVETALTPGSHPTGLKPGADEKNPANRL